jgi:hypothetical protein
MCIGRFRPIRPTSSYGAMRALSTRPPQKRWEGDKGRRPSAGPAGVPPDRSRNLAGNAMHQAVGVAEIFPAEFGPPRTRNRRGFDRNDLLLR